MGIGFLHALMHASDRKPLDNSYTKADEILLRLQKLTEHTHRYRKEQIALGTVATFSIPCTYVGYKIFRRLGEYECEKRYAYKAEKCNKNYEYRKNPTFGAYCKKSAWILKNQIQNAARFTVYAGLGISAVIIPSTVSLATLTFMYLNYQYHWHYKSHYNYEKRT